MQNIADISRQQEIVDRFRAASREDERICTIEVSGSLQRSEGDYFSDVDLSIRVKEGHYAEMAAAKRAFFHQVVPTIACVDAYHDDNFSTCGCLFENLVCADMGIVRESFAPVGSTTVALEEQAFGVRQSFLRCERDVSDALAQGHLWLARDGVENQMRFQLFRLLYLFHGSSRPTWPGRKIEPLLQRLGLSDRMQKTVCTHDSESIRRAHTMLCDIFEEQFSARLATNDESSSNATSRAASAVSALPGEGAMPEVAHQFWYETANIIRFAGRGELWFARFNHESCVMEAILRLVEHATGIAFRWHSRGFYSTIESIDELSSELGVRLTEVCQSDDRSFSWRGIHGAMELFTELAGQTGLRSRSDYPIEGERRVPGYAREVQAFARPRAFLPENVPPSSR